MIIDPLNITMRNRWIEFETGDIQREEVIKEVLDIYGGLVPPEYEDYIDSD